MSGNSSPEESEEAVSQYLQDLGMLEDGMTSHDKRNLWAVIKISQDTAKAEEEDRQEHARQALQFDKICTTGKSSLGSGADPDGNSEESARFSHETEDMENEEEKKPIIAAVLPQLHATPMVSVKPSQCTAATVVPVLLPYDGDKSPNQHTVNSGLSLSPNSISVTDFPENQIDSKPQDSQSSPRHVQPSDRSCLRWKSNVEMKAAGKMDPRNNSSNVCPQNQPFSGLLDKKGDDLQMVPETHHVSGSLKSEAINRNTGRMHGDTLQISKPSRKSESCGHVSIPSSPVDVVESPKHSDSNYQESFVSNVQEPSLVDRIQHSSKMSCYHKSHTKERHNHKSEVNEDCYEEINISALTKEEFENMGIEKCASVCSAVDNVPSPVSGTLLDNATSVTDCDSSGYVKKTESVDQERNINPFDCDRSNYERTLKVHKVKRTCSRCPFYIPPFKMDVGTYITYFKRNVSEQTARLIEVQQRNHKCVPWGEPIVVGDASSRVMLTVGKGEQKNKGLANPQRYNFWDSKVTYKQEDIMNEDSDAHSSDDIFFTDNSRRKAVAESQEDVTNELFDALLEEEKSVDKKEDEESPLSNDAHNSDKLTTVDRQGTMKRKSDTSDNQTFDKEKKSSKPQKRVSPSHWLTAQQEEMPPVSRKKNKKKKNKKFGQGMCSAESEHSGGDLDGDFEPAKRKKLLQRNQARMSFLRKKTWINGSSNQSKSTRKGGDLNYQVSMFDDLDSTEGVGDGANAYPAICQQTEVIRPGPLELRRKGHHNQLEMDKHGDTEYKENEATPEDDITVVYNAESSCVEEQEAGLVPCPICRKTFSTKDIEAHASECSEYCEEELQADELHVSSSSSSSQMVRQSSK